MGIHHLTVAVEEHGTVQGFLTVKFDRYDDSRVQYQWTVEDHEHNVLGSGDDLRSGSGAEIDHWKIMGTFATFLGACAESYGSGGDNADLFPPAVAEWADAVSDALAIVAQEIEETS